MLKPYRVLDLTTERGLLCAQSLGDMGADVIKIEPLGGSEARDIPPFYNDAPHRERSLYCILQSHGVAAHRVQNSFDAYRDPQFLHREHFVDINHPRVGTFTLEGPRANLSRTPDLVRRAAPFLGQDNQYVLAEILGYDEDRITELVSSGVLG